MACVSTVSFSVLVNGILGQPFQPTRGLWQGDPLSPYLFLIISEALSRNIMKCSESSEIKGIRIARGSPTLSHLFFADDSLFFLRADQRNCYRFRELLHDYCLASGQSINYDKSCMYFSQNTPANTMSSISSLLGFKEVSNPGTHLGLPTIWGRSKKMALGIVKERVKKKIEGWKASCLSLAGKEVLIKAVAMAVPAYPMHCFKFLAGLCQEINGDLARFWWAN
ncbi:hypothetical protein CerSpe_073180 [Prunus speciosa]